MHLAIAFEFVVVRTNCGPKLVAYRGCKITTTLWLPSLPFFRLFWPLLFSALLFFFSSIQRFLSFPLPCRSLCLFIFFFLATGLQSFPYTFLSSCGFSAFLSLSFPFRWPPSLFSSSTLVTSCPSLIFRLLTEASSPYFPPFFHSMAFTFPLSRSYTMNPSRSLHFSSFPGSFNPALFLLPFGFFSLFFSFCLSIRCIYFFTTFSSAVARGLCLLWFPTHSLPFFPSPVASSPAHLFVSFPVSTSPLPLLPVGCWTKAYLEE